MAPEYTRGSVVRLKSSTSLMHRNLCVARGLQDKDSLSYAVAHKGTASFVHVTAGGQTAQTEVDYEPTKDKDPMAYITQVSSNAERASKTLGAVVANSVLIFEFCGAFLFEFVVGIY